MAMTDTTGGGSDGKLPPFASRLGAAIEAKGCSLEWLHRRLVAAGSPVSVATLSYWRSGKRRPEGAASLAAVGAIEEQLGLEPGELMSRLGPSRRGGPRGTSRTIVEAFHPENRVEAALSELGLLHVDPMLELDINATLDLDEHGHTRVLTTRRRVQARHDGADRLLVVLVLDDTLAEPVRYEAIAGGAFGRQIIQPEHGLGVSEFLLERPLRQGERTVAEYRLLLPPGMGDTYYEHTLRRRTHQVTIWVRFDSARVPAHAQSYVAGDDEETLHLEVRDATSVHQAFRNCGPGEVGIRWAW